MAYVDLNPVRAGIAYQPETLSHTAIIRRERNPAASRIQLFNRRQDTVGSSTAVENWLSARDTRANRL
jgi:hypothetical protein